MDHKAQHQSELGGLSLAHQTQHIQIASRTRHVGNPVGALEQPDEWRGKLSGSE
jgi:hypothetical protein